MGISLTYHRRKTGRQITITVTKDAMNIIREYMDTTTESPYLFPILSAEGGEDTIYREYQQALRIFNYQLTKLGELLGLTTELTSYTARHTWATLALLFGSAPGYYPGGDGALVYQSNRDLSETIQYKETG